MKVKHLPANHELARRLHDYPCFYITAAISKMKRAWSFKPESVLLVRCGSLVFNVTDCPEIYNQAN
jgi:hypothetical protein